MKQRVYYIVGGGTSGHVNPALSIAESIQERDPNSKIVFFVTRDGVEYEMIQNAGFPYKVIEASRLPNSAKKLFSFVKTSFSGYRNCIRILHEERPSAVIGTGGFVCAPLLLAAMRLRVPYLIHEQNAFPGKANRFFAKKAQAVCISFDSSKEHFKNTAKIHFTGNPVRKVFFEISSEEARRRLDISSEKFIVLIMGGSLGANSINQAIIDLFETNMWQEVKAEFPELMLVMSTGSRNYNALNNTLSSYENEDFIMKSYLDTTLWLPASDLYIGRSGASACFEAAATSKPAIFIPYVHAADNHQFFNAQSFVKRKAAGLIEEKDFDAKILVEKIKYLIENRQVLHSMSKQAKSLAKPNAASEIVDILEKIVSVNLD
ncbi:MAG TPA: undecaprenyldiphospho-muramoylpentapeptide beta-N-acetylglucosaminyltransferase [Clostridiaceae bacterium]|nr:undecaprenyldiphospho-muramoylpentapeptide beta-N-acetylglucosaminyltransferase [Clostridiaceae bacterium]